MISHNGRASKCHHCQDWRFCLAGVHVFVCTGLRVTNNNILISLWHFKDKDTGKQMCEEVHVGPFCIPYMLVNAAAVGVIV